LLARPHDSVPLSEAVLDFNDLIGTRAGNPRLPVSHGRRLRASSLKRKTAAPCLNVRRASAPVALSHRFA